MNNIEDVLTWMCGFRASDAKSIAAQCQCKLNASAHPAGEAPEEVVSAALLEAVDEHVAGLPAEERERLDHSVKALHETFAEPDGLIEGRVVRT